MIIGAGSTSFEMVRYVGDRFWLIPLPPWADHDIDPISIRDALYYLLAGAAVPVPTGLAADLIESLDHPMTASDTVLRDHVPDPPGGLTAIDDAVAAADGGDGDARRCATCAGVDRRDTRMVGRRTTHRPGPPAVEGACAVTFAEICAVVTNTAVPQPEWASMVRRRRIVVCIVLVIGAVLLGFSLTRTPGDTTFYWLTLALAATWALGALVAGPLHLGCIRWRGRNQRPVLTGLAVGLLLGGVFVVGGMAAREIGPVAEFITRVLEYTNHGSLVLVVVITSVNGFAEELFFRGALYSALGVFHPVLISTLLYAIATTATGNPMLGFAAIILGTVCAWERRATGGVLAPVLTHVVWGLIMVLALPPMFGVWH